MKNYGFTLIELMIVIVIMGILIMIGLTTFMTSQQRGRDSRRKGDIRQVATALEFYFSDKGRYPDSDASGKIMGCYKGGLDDQACVWGVDVVNDSKTVYMAKLPSDPISTLKYYYSHSGNSFRLYARLENTQDPRDIISPSGTNCSSTATPLDCNYGISSTNTTP